MENLKSFGCEHQMIENTFFEIEILNENCCWMASGPYLLFGIHIE